jgi:autoinducer 2-degrading protein
MLDVAYRLVTVPGAEDHVWAALRASAEASRSEPGIQWFEAFRSEADPGNLLVVERYADAEAYAVHRASAHYAEWKAASAGRIASSERFLGAGSS